MVEKLIVKDGIIQNKEIDGIPVYVKIIKPKGSHNVRSLEKLRDLIGITNHNTGNSNAGADDEMHYRYFQNIEDRDSNYISAHIFVDEDSITQIIPLDEVAYHAGDGQGDGNRETISIEICENKNLEKAEENAIKLNASILLAYPELKIYKHQDWSGKYCPRKIIPHWDEFVNNIYKEVNMSKQKEDIYEDKMNLNVLGKNITVDGIMKDGHFYCGIRNLFEQLGLEVEWTEEVTNIKLK